jgi:hypothetical protein
MCVVNDFGRSIAKAITRSDPVGALRCAMHDTIPGSDASKSPTSARDERGDMLTHLAQLGVRVVREHRASAARRATTLAFVFAFSEQVQVIGSASRTSILTAPLIWSSVSSDASESTHVLHAHVHQGPPPNPECQPGKLDAHLQPIAPAHAHLETGAQGAKVATGRRWLFISCAASSNAAALLLAFGLADRNRMPVMTRQSEAGSASLLAPSLGKRRRSSEHDPLRRLFILDQLRTGSHCDWSHRRRWRPNCRASRHVGMLPETQHHPARSRRKSVSSCATTDGPADRKCVYAASLRRLTDIRSLGVTDPQSAAARTVLACRPMGRLPAPALSCVRRRGPRQAALTSALRGGGHTLNAARLDATCPLGGRGHAASPPPRSSAAPTHRDDHLEAAVAAPVLPARQRCAGESSTVLNNTDMQFTQRWRAPFAAAKTKGKRWIALSDTLAPRVCFRICDVCGKCCHLPSSGPWVQRLELRYERALGELNRALRWKTQCSLDVPE